jgi:dTDP-4-amino-4,6-dideoxygalactose transaminase
MAGIIQVADPSREYRAMATEIDAAVHRVARNGTYVCGPEHDAFESEFAAYVGARHAVGTGNCTDALEIALRSFGSGPGDEVVTVANAGGFALAATRAVGATPRFVDVRPDDLLADTDQVEASICDRTTAIVVTHLFGQLHPGIESLADLCARRGVPLIEDCAQSVGARADGRHAGTFGDAAAFSFYPTKNLGAMGDGGMLCTDDAALARRFRALGGHGRGASTDPACDGARNSRLDELQAAVLRVKLRHLDELLARRRSVADAYRAAAPHRWWAGRTDRSFAAHLAVTRSVDRSDVRARARERGIATSVRFDPPDHLRAGRTGSTGGLPVTERACSEVVAFPCHAYLSDEELATVCAFLADTTGP